MAQSASGPGASARLPELSAGGERVHVRTLRAEDDEAYRRAVDASARRMSRWNPVNADDLAHRLVTQTVDNRTFFVLANEPVGDHPIVGRVNLFGAQRGRFRSITMGYDSYDPYAGRGLFAEGLRLVVGLVFADAADGGMDLHRVDANVQPGNVTSAGLLRSLGFRHEGHSCSLLFLPDEAGHEEWRHHERFAITREDWPAAPYGAWRPHPVLAWLRQADDAVGHDLARRLAVELSVPVLPADLPGLAELVESSPAGALVRAAGQAALPGLPVVDVGERAAAYGVRPGTAWDPRSVTRLALELRAAARTGT